jgi:hypothetical protein
MASETASERPRLFGLLRELPNLVSRLIHDEIAAAKAEIASKAKAAGLGAGLVAGGAILALFAFGALLAAAILALAMVLPPWLSALIVALVLLAVAVVVALLGVKKLKAGVPPTPTDSIESVKRDIRVIKGAER